MMPAAPVVGVHHQVVKGAGRPPERHPVGVLEAGIDEADHPAVLLGDQDHDVGPVELAGEKGPVPMVGLGLGGDEAGRVPGVMLAHEEAAKPAESRSIGWGGGADQHRSGPPGG